MTFYARVDNISTGLLIKYLFIYLPVLSKSSDRHTYQCTPPYELQVSSSSTRMLNRTFLVLFMVSTAKHQSMLPKL